MIVTPDGQEILGGPGSGFGDAPHEWKTYEPERALPLIRAAKERHESFLAMKEAGDKAGIEALRSEIRAEVEYSYPPLLDTRLSTARVLVNRGPDMDILRPLLLPLQPGEKDHFEVGVRDMVFEALGQFLTDDRPFRESAVREVRAVYASLPPGEAHQIIQGVMKRKGTRKVEIADLPVPASARKTAAELLVHMTGQKPADDIVTQAIALWKSQGE